MIQRGIGIRFLLILALALLLWSPFGQRALDVPVMSFILVRIVPFAMVLYPLASALSERTVPLEGIRRDRQRERIRGLARNLWIATGVGLVVVVATQVGDHRLVGLGWMVPFLILETYFAGPLRREKSLQSTGEVFMPALERTASLTPRHQSSVLPRWVWILPWGFWLASALWALHHILKSANVWRREDVVAFLDTASAPLIVVPLVQRSWAQQPEPMDPNGSPELAQLYERARRVKLWGLWVLVVEWVAVFTWMAVLCALGSGGVALLVQSACVVLFVSGMGFVAAYRMERRKAAALLRELSPKAASSS